jgi:hypothetical protein
MITILIAILLLVTATFICRLMARRIGCTNFKQLAFVVLLVSTIYLLLLVVGSSIGAESTPVWVTTINRLDQKIKIYTITVYDHPVYDDLSRFVYKGGSLNVGDSSTTIIEYYGAIEFWTVGLDDLDKVVFFDTTNSHSISKYKFNIDEGYITDQSKVQLAINDIIIYSKDKLTKDILIGFNILLTLLLLIEILTSRTASDKFSR